MSKEFFYSIATIFGIVFVSLFLFSQPVYSVPILRLLGLILLPIISIVILIKIFKKQQTNSSKYDVLNIFLITFKIVAIFSFLFSIISFAYAFLSKGDLGPGGFLPIAVFAVVTIPASLAYLILYLIKVANSKN